MTSVQKVIFYFAFRKVSATVLKDSRPSGLNLELVKAMRHHENEKNQLRLFEDVGAIRHGHFVLHDWDESDTFFDADQIFARPGMFSYSVAMGIIRQLPEDLEIEAIVGPANGATVLAQWIGIGLNSGRRSRDIVAMSLRKDGEDFSMTKKQNRLLSRKKVLLVDDVVTKGASLRAVAAELTEFHPGCKIVGAAVICNRNGVTAETLGVPLLHSIVELEMKLFAPDSVPGWLDKIPIDTELGRGARLAA